MTVLPEAVFFDFDGVLAESNDIKTAAFRDLFEPEGAVIAQKVVAHHLAHGGMSRYEKFEHYYAHFLHRELTPAVKAGLSERFSQLVVEKVVAAPAVPGAMEFLERHHGNLTLCVVSATPTSEIREICRRRGIDHFFCQITGSPDSKGANVARILESEHLDPSRCVFVGDAMSDYRAARDNGVAFVGRLTGDNEQILAGLSGVLISDLHDLEEAIDEALRG